MVCMYFVGADNEPTIENFVYEEVPVPEELEVGDIGLQTLFLSLDPAMVSLKEIISQTD